MSRFTESHDVTISISNPDDYIHSTNMFCTIPALVREHVCSSGRKAAVGSIAAEGMNTGMRTIYNDIYTTVPLLIQAFLGNSHMCLGIFKSSPQTRNGYFTCESGHVVFRGCFCRVMRDSRDDRVITKAYITAEQYRHVLETSAQLRRALSC